MRSTRPRGVDGREYHKYARVKEANRKTALLFSAAAGAGAGVRGAGASGHCRAMVLRRATCGDPGAAAGGRAGPGRAAVRHLLQDPARTDAGLSRVSFRRGTRRVKSAARMRAVDQREQSSRRESASRSARRRADYRFCNFSNKSHNDQLLPLVARRVGKDARAEMIYNDFRLARTRYFLRN